MFERSDLFDAALMERLAGHALAGPPTLHPQRGAHRSPRRGESQEFSEHTAYAPGDDLRHLDWKVLAKTDRPYVRRFEDERLQRVLFVLDASASMAYGGAEGSLLGSKFHLAAQIVVAAGACLIRQGDAVGLCLVGGAAPGEPPLYLAPRGGASHLEALIEILARAKPSGTARMTAACRAAADRLGRSASVFAVSDFLDEDDEDWEELPLLRARSLLPRLIHVLHPDETDLPFDRVFRFVDMEGPTALLADPDALRSAYVAEVRAFVGRMEARAAKAGASYVLARTAGEAANRLAGAFARGEL